MLYIVLVLVLAAFGLLIVALTTANTLWAWFSVIISVVAAALLVLDWISGRRAKARAPAAAPDEAPRTDETPEAPDSATAPAEPLAESPVEETPAEPPPVSAASAPLTDQPPTEPTEATEPTPPPAQPVADSTEEPGEEETDASDLLVVTDLAVEVRVVDEHPRYHLTQCTWLVAKQTIPLPVSEARQLGFTPCARCGPDATIAARHRGER